MPEATETVDPKQALLKDPTNLQILIYLFERSASLTGLAEALNLAPMEAHFRVNQLAAAGWLTSSLKESAPGVHERCFAPAVSDLAATDLRSSDTEKNLMYINLIVNNLRQDLTALAPHPGDALVHLLTVGIRAPRSLFEVFRRKLEDLAREFEASEETAEDSWVYLTTALYEKRPSSAANEEVNPDAQAQG